MRKEDVVLAYKMLVQMKDIVNKLDNALEKHEFEMVSQLKEKLFELQRSFDKIL
ncbi:MAG: hypothetical protein AABX23_03820 [Nanoarchaeota archaeon]